MHALVAHLTTALFAAHALLGCCWHHAHAVASCEPQSLVRCCVEDGHDDDCGYDEESRHESGKQPDEQESQCLGRCHYVIQPRTDVVDPLRIASTALPSMASVLVAAMPVIEATADPRDGPAPAPLRLHLLHRIMLI